VVTETAHEDRFTAERVGREESRDVQEAGQRV
jgi:hypothetical protein